MKKLNKNMLADKSQMFAFMTGHTWAGWQIAR
jgi:hypothetical protein